MRLGLNGSGLVHRASIDAIADHAKTAADDGFHSYWLAEHPIPQQGTVADFYYASYASSQAMSQVVGEHWEGYFPRVVRRILPHQDRDG